ncbi:hypothetical protein LTR85_006675 [Meristemomyces frigidus]|nr:hypothetical protein LTR85_006675 [Meristemomyces frigidus]
MREDVERCRRVGDEGGGGGGDSRRRYPTPRSEQHDASASDFNLPDYPTQANASYEAGHSTSDYGGNGIATVGGSAGSAEGDRVVAASNGPLQPAAASWSVVPQAAPTASPDHGDREITDAATILEFIAWGKRKEVGYVTRLHPYADEPADPSKGGGMQGHDTPSWQSPDEQRAQDLSSMQMQLLLPDRALVFQLVRYHVECLLWYHGSFHGPTLLKQLDEFYEYNNGCLDIGTVDMQWIALLFAILTASIACGNKPAVLGWGFKLGEQELLSQKWLQATVGCLQKAQYMANPSILACEAISTLTMSAHLLGCSNQQAILLASATRIAQSLGLHRLDDTAERTIEVETGRRVWAQLCTQDWFSIPFSECYLVNPLYSKSKRPLNCDDETLQELPFSEPTVTSYCAFLNSIAELMPSLQDGIESTNTLFTRYEEVMKYDRKMRALASEQRPPFLCAMPVAATWPLYTPWARRAAAISSSHKIIMIHRKFLSMSFTNPAFVFTRRTCIAASKTILKEFRQAVSEAGPVLWVYHAFSVAAGITLCLDIFHRETLDPLCHAHELLVVDAIASLGQAHNSKIATRGTRILSDLLTVARNANASRPSATLGKRNAQWNEEQSASHKRSRVVDMRTVLRNLRDGMRGREITAGLSETATAPRQLPGDQQQSDNHNSNPPNSFDMLGGFEASAFAEAEEMLSTLHSSFAGSNADPFGSLLNLSHNYDYF